MNPGLPPPPAPTSLTANLQAHLTLCAEVLELVTREREALRGADPFASQAFAQQRNALLPRLTQSLDSLRRTRTAWQQLDAATRARQTEAEALMRRNQDLIMKIIVLDRENEQALLRQGLFPPGQFPTANCQRPHVVAAQYLKHVAP
jgi:hypothetical protein